MIAPRGGQNLLGSVFGPLGEKRKSLERPRPRERDATRLRGRIRRARRGCRLRARHRRPAPSAPPRRRSPCAAIAARAQPRTRLRRRRPRLADRGVERARAGERLLHVARVADDAGVVAHPRLDFRRDRAGGDRARRVEGRRGYRPSPASTRSSADASGVSASRRAAICSAQRVPNTWPALSAAPPGRVTPCVPAASPTA